MKQKSTVVAGFHCDAIVRLIQLAFALFGLPEPKPPSGLVILNEIEVDHALCRRADLCEMSQSELALCAPTRRSSRCSAPATSRGWQNHTSRGRDLSARKGGRHPSSAGGRWHERTAGHPILIRKDKPKPGKQKANSSARLTE
jgi:hypothetical protein